LACGIEDKGRRAMTLAAVEGKSTPFALSLQELLPTGMPRDSFYLLRSQAKRKLEEIGLPDRIDGPFQYFPLRAFYEERLTLARSSSIVDEEIIQQHLVPECKESCLVFVDGHFRPELSILHALDPKVGVLSLEEAMKTFNHFLSARIGKLIKEEKDPFSLLNMALYPQGAFLYIPPKLVLEKPIQVLHIVTQEGTLIAPRLHVFLGAHAEAKLYLSACACQWQEGLILGAVDIALEEGARLDAIATSFAHSHGWTLDYVRASLKRDSFFKIDQVCRKGLGLRKDVKVDLLGEGASAEINGLALLFEQEQAHTHVIVNHEAPHTRSSQHFKGVLADHSQSSTEGKILVQRAAQKTQAYQLCNYLLLGDRAIANSKPNLEIFADDVKASHGATMAQLKERELFYLQSRGIDVHQAKKLLIEGFCQGILEKLFLPSLKEELRSWIRNC
jgi:Fe-S cluster assembly protein SufD